MANKKITFELDINGKAIDVVIDKTLNLKQQVRELTKELNKTQEGTDQFRLLSAKLNETRDNVDRVNAKSRELFSTVSLLPGPIGDFGSKIDGSINLLKTFSSFKLSDISNQFKELGKDAMDIIKNILGLSTAQKVLAVSEGEAAVAATAETVALEAQTVATETAEVATIGLGTALKAIGIGLIIAGLAALVVYWDKISDAIRGVTEETKLNNSVSEKQSSIAGEQIGNLEKLRASTLANNLTERQKIELVKEYNSKFGDTLGAVKTYIELQDKLTGPKFEQYKSYLLKKAEAEAIALLITENTKNKIIEGMKDPASMASVFDVWSEGGILGFFIEGKSGIGKNIQQRVLKTFDSTISKLQGKLLTAQGEVTKAQKDLGLDQPPPETTKTTTTKEDPRVQQKKDTIKAIAELEKKSFMDSLTGQEKELYETNQNYVSLLFDANRFGLDTTLLKEQQRKDVLAINKKYDDAEVKRQQDASKAIQDFEIQLAKDLQKIDDDKQSKKVKDLEDQLSLDESRLKSFTENTLSYFEQQRKIEDDNYKLQLEKNKGNKKQLETVEQDHANVIKAIDKSVNDFKQQQLLATIDMYGQFGSALQQLAGKNKTLAKTGLLIEKAAGIATIIINTQKAASKAGYFSPLGIATIIAGAASVATSIAAAVKGVQEIDASGGGNGGGSGGSVAAPTIQNKAGYANGGMINGPRHAGGGVMINAEGGEAVMTRGAVTMFAPLLSAMNQMGGGTSFSQGAVGQASYDNPQSSQSEQMIIKTYVVENELTSSQHRQARLKDLSTL